MGAVGGLLGTAGGMNGTGFNAPSGTNQAQLDTSYNQNQQAMQGQQGLLSALQNQNGLGNQSQVYNQTQGIVNGQGPNPAQAMLNQATGQNVANQASLMAGQRGAGANAGLMARQAAQTGANLQQQAAGQGATMQANQSLNALGQAGQMANTMAGQQIGQTNQNVASAQNEQGILQGANSANNQIQGNLAGQTMGNQQKGLGGLGNAAATAAVMALAPGGQVPVMNQPQSMFAQSLMGQPAAPAMAEGGKVPAMVSPGEKFLKPNEAQAVAQGRANPLKVGETIPGKAKVKGDSYSNDIVKKDLDEGGVVIKRSIMNKNDADKAAAFVRAVMAKKGKRA